MDKVYSADTIPDEPFPTIVNDPTTSVTTTQPAANGVTGAVNIPNQAVPAKQPSTELVSTQLNTKTKKILASFSFTPQGSIKIGDFTMGQAGEIDIDPDGIIARNVNGIVTFALDGDTGDATFAGTITAGALVSGEVIVGNGSIVIDGTQTQINIFDATGNNTVRLDETGLLGFTDAGVEIMHLTSTALEFYGDTGDVIRILDKAAGTLYGKMGYFTGGSFNHGVILDSRGSVQLTNYDPSGSFVTVQSQLVLGYNSPLFEDVYLGSTHGNVNINAGGDINVTPSGSFKINGSVKTAIVPTSEGYNALYCVESPEVWFFDFAIDSNNIDPMFLEATEGEMKTITTDDGELLIFRRRKGFGRTRFEGKTFEEFERNNSFWNLKK